VTTLADLIARVRANALDRPRVDFLATTTLNSTDTVSPATFQDGTQFNVGGVLDFDDATFEACYVSAKPTPPTATLVRAWESVAAAHSAGARIRVNPRYRMFTYRQAVNSSLAAIGATMKRNAWDTTQSFSGTSGIFTVPATATRVVGVYLNPAQNVAGGTTTLNGVAVDYLGSVPTAISATGKAVRLRGRNPGTGTAYVHYQDPWPLLVAATDTLDPDYPPDGEDLITLGAECFLLDHDGFSVVAFQEPHVHARQFGSKQSDVDTAWTRKMQRFFTRRSEVAASRPKRNAAWLKGL
jgi:hypothetical protein